MTRRNRRDREWARHARRQEAAGPAGLYIDVTLHCLRTQLERCGYGRELTFGEVQHEVLEAFVSGRLSKQRPDWLDRADWRPADPGCVYVWPADRSRCWVVDWSRPRTLVVLTTLAQPPVNNALQSELARWARAQGDE